MEEEHVDQGPPEILTPEEQEHVDMRAWEGAEVLTNSEASLLLKRRVQLHQQKNIAYEPPGVMTKTLDYCTKFANCTNQDSMNEMRRILILDYGFKHHELGIILNLMPETADEARTLVPSLADPGRFDDDDHLERALEEVSKYRET
ncbi:hypothetical protein FOA52_000919 [Chlamydomonas sp. UWO 241]|nr:hypothetical protein FOA52_000919 [Chlamydomonas sp. UWO 241]